MRAVTASHGVIGNACAIIFKINLHFGRKGGTLSSSSFFLFLIYRYKVKKKREEKREKKRPQMGRGGGGGGGGRVLTTFGNRFPFSGVPLANVLKTF